MFLALIIILIVLAVFLPILGVGVDARITNLLYALIVLFVLLWILQGFGLIPNFHGGVICG